MVQDTSGSHEVYRAVLPGNKLGGWGLSEEYQGEDDLDTDDINVPTMHYDHVMEEKTSLWTVSVPGETDWVTEVSLLG